MMALVRYQEEEQAWLRLRDSPRAVPPVPAIDVARVKEAVAPLGKLDLAEFEEAKQDCEMQVSTSLLLPKVACMLQRRVCVFRRTTLSSSCTADTST
jgi:hypothetical protein